MPNFTVKKVFLILIVQLSLLLPAMTWAEDFIVITGIDSPIPRLTAYQINSIFMDKSREIYGVQVQPLDLSPWTDAKEAFYLTILKKNSSQLNAYWARKLFTGRGKPPRHFSDVKSMYHFMQENPSSIAYISPEQLDEARVKVIYRPQ